ncbi:MAG: thioesterase family protein [Oscillospiraceae bacterium]|jgi:Predicted thioesterase|nr:thioesterase family protein [Oscillospiraceae bacterium]
MLEPGVRGAAEVTVVPENTAAAAGSGALPVFATPCMIALMEKAAMNSVQPFLDEGQGTVGTRIDVSHLAATPVGMAVRAETELTAIDRRRLTFSVKAFADGELIGEGTHERFIVESARFLQKAEAKRK